MSNQAPSYHGYRFPSEIISHAVWLYYRFALSFRGVEDLLAQRGITVTYETIRQWCLTFGRDYARTRAIAFLSPHPPLIAARPGSSGGGDHRIR